MSVSEMSARFGQGLVMLESSFVATAIVTQFTPNGFVIAADGLRRTEPDGQVINETAPKIFKLVGTRRSIAFAFAGNVHILNAAGEIVFQLPRRVPAGRRGSVQSNIPFCCLLPRSPCFTD